MEFAAYLLDIEGTTTPIDFVTKTLFPYAREHMAQFLISQENDPQLHSDMVLLRQEYEAEPGPVPPWPNRPEPIGSGQYLDWLMQTDRKSPALKSIQGRIWSYGYQSGAILGEIYSDVEPALRRWQARGASIHIYSSGSVLAQKLLFGHLPNGDLNKFIDSNFDTSIGVKKVTESYVKIALHLCLTPANILFLSDSTEEVSAAKSAGFSATQVDRLTASSNFPFVVASFDDVP